jgi:hypothetical protein
LGVDDARASARQLQDRAGLTQPSLPHSPDELVTGVRALLLEASDDGTLVSAPHEILQMLREQRQGRNPQLVMIWCGETLDKGQAGEFLRLSNGGRLSFALTAEYAGQPRRLLSYKFHLRRPDGSQPIFLRFDLNGELAAHEPLEEPRCHIHPGDDHVRIQCPILSPTEILFKCLYGI